MAGGGPGGQGGLMNYVFGCFGRGCCLHWDDYYALRTITLAPDTPQTNSAERVEK